MTEAKIKEQVGVQFLGMLAALKGYLVSLPYVDEGLDGVIYSPTQYLRSIGNKRHLLSGFSVGFQMKTTTVKQIVREATQIKYDLAADNYNDLLFWRGQKAEGTHSPMPTVLILLVLPDKQEEWLDVDFDSNHFCLNTELFWFYPSESDDFTRNTATQRISIPLSQKIDLDFFRNVFNLFFKNQN